MDYFAYSKGGNRFRAINGLQKVGEKYYFQNYNNFEYKGNEKVALSDYHILFEQDKLTKLSEIDLENITSKIISFSIDEFTGIDVLQNAENAKNAMYFVHETTLLSDITR